MSITQRLRSIDKRLVLAIIGVLVGVVGLYAAFSEPKASMSFVNINETNVLDVHEELEDLTILFQGEAIQEENLNLRIITLRVENSGQKSILQSYYDQEDVWGIEIKNGEIIEVRLVNSNSSYVTENLNPKLVKEENIVEFRKIIFERRDYFILEVLVLHEKEKQPEVVAVGKIAGIKKIEVVKSRVGTDEQNFLGEMLQGSALVHFVRSISYIIIFMISVGTIAGLAIGISGWVNSVRRGSRSKRINRLVVRGDIKEGDLHKELIKMYVQGGLESLRETKMLLENKGRLGLHLRRYKRLPERLTREEEVVLRRHEFVPKEVRRLIEGNVVSIGRGNQVVVDEEFEESLEKVLPYLEAEEAIELVISEKG